jgi:hypothetical protein
MNNQLSEMISKHNTIKKVATNYVALLIETCWWPVDDVETWNVTKIIDCDPNETCILCLCKFNESNELIQYKANCCNVYYHHSCINEMFKRDFKSKCIHCNVNVNQLS